MTWPRVPLSLIALISLVLFGLVRALPLAQAPNQADMVMHTVAGVKFGTLPGFVLERVNPAEKTDSYVALTFDSMGRLVVSKEQDHPRILLDSNDDGIFDAEQIITDRVSNCQGLWFDGPTLYGACSNPHAEPIAPPQRPSDAPIPPGPGSGRSPRVGNWPPAPPAAGGRGVQPAGIFRMQDTTGDGIAETFDTLVPTVGVMGEHGPHAIRRAPDGSFAFLSGNDATIPDDHLAPDSPVVNDKDAQFLEYLPNFGRSIRQGVHSAVYLWDPAIDRFRVLFGGNRNAYDFAFNLAGEAFLFDSDMEWDLNLPWFREVRTVHGIPGGNYGYRDGSGKYPDYYLDSLPPVRDVGRGSPVGVEFYTSYAYPREFFETFFEADWSRGRLLYTALTQDGATYRARDDRAEFVHGQPFNITDVEVGPDGMLYFTTGGRNTSGGVWRLRYTETVPEPPDMTGILAVVRQPQPYSSWGWAAIQRVKASMGASFGPELEKLARDTSAASLDRMRAVYELQRHGAPPSAELLGVLARDGDAAVRAAAVFVAGVQGGSPQGAPPAQAAVAAGALRDADPFVRRRAAEALVRMGQSPDAPSLAPVEDIYALLDDPDRFVRWAGRLALERTPRAAWRDRAMKDMSPLSGVESMLAIVNTANGEDLRPLIEKQFTMMKRADLSAENHLRLYRAFQYTATEFEGGLGPALREQLHGLVVNRFPADDERLNRELALLLAYGGQPQAIQRILAAMPEGDENQPLQIHYLYALRTIEDGWRLEDKTALAELLGRMSAWRGGAQFINFVGQLFDTVEPLFATDEEKTLLFAKAPDFSPLTPEQLEEIKERMAQAGRGGRGGRGMQSPLAARRMGMVLSRQEMLEEAVFQPQQKLDAAAGREVFQASCASWHRFGERGTDHGVAALDLSSSPALSSKYALLEAVMLPHRHVAPDQQTSVITTTDGRTLRGLAISETGDRVSLLTPEAEVVEVAAGQIKSRTREPRSIMTEELADRLGQAQLRNLAEFLVGSASTTSSR
jgi:putative heme-binding domain-containing protein